MRTEAELLEVGEALKAKIADARARQAGLAKVLEDVKWWNAEVTQLNLELSEVVHDLALVKGLPDPLGPGNEPIAV